jgi:signal transduction histidine kinase
LIGAAAIVLSVTSYQYSSSATQKILILAADDIRSNSEIQVHDLSNILINKVSAINNNLGVISSAPVFQDTSQLETAKTILSGTQETTKDLTEFYFWLDQNGKLVWVSNITTVQLEQIGVDRSFREYFTGPRDTGSIYYSTTIISADGVPRIHIASPIYDNAGQFKGVIAAGIRVEVLGNYLQSQISPKYIGQVGMLDRNGIILYSTNPANIGHDVFGEEVQSQLPGEIKIQFNAFIERSLSGGSGAEDISYQGETGSLAYQTVTVDGKNFAVLFVTAEHNFASDVLSLVEQQRIFSIVAIAVIAALAVGMAILVLSWNKQLQGVVSAKTGELEFANKSLKARSDELEKALETVEESNRQLEVANEQLKAHDLMQTEFVNIAAHELRTPIQPLLGAAEMLEEELQKSSEKMNIDREEVEIIIRNAKRLGRLSSDLLEVSRIESKSFKITKEPVNINMKIQNVIIDSRSFIDENRKIEMIFRPASNEPVVVEADKSKVFEVLSNIIRNAIKFTKEGTITIISDVIDGAAVVKVKDTGSGIDPEIMPKLFTRFASKSESGTGLGLFIAKNIVEAHGGKIWAENNSDGRGATFAFSLPLAKIEEKEFTK